MGNYVTICHWQIRRRSIISITSPLKLVTAAKQSTTRRNDTIRQDKILCKCNILKRKTGEWRSFIKRSPSPKIVTFNYIHSLRLFIWWHWLSSIEEVEEEWVHEPNGTSSPATSQFFLSFWSDKLFMWLIVIQQHVTISFGGHSTAVTCGSGRSGWWQLKSGLYICSGSQILRILI